jgi:hypothetical protein
MKRIRRSFAVAILAAIAAALPARAGALDDRLPAETMLYTGWAGAEALGPAYNASNLKQILDASAIASFINKQIPELIARASEEDPEAARKIAMVQRGLGIAWRHPVAFYFCPIDFTDPRKPAFRFGLLCDAGEDAKALHDLLAPLVEGIPANADLPVRLSQEGGLTLLAFGKADAVADLKAGGTLAASPAYAKAMAQVKQSGQALAFYADMQKIVGQINDGIARAPDAPAEMKTKTPAVLEALGLRSLTQVAMLAGFEGKGWQQHAFVGINGPRTGLLSLLDSAPISEELLAVVPQNAASFAATRFDLQKLYAEVRKVVTVIDPRALAELDRAIAGTNRELGINLETDLLNALGDEWVVYRAPVLEQGLSYALVHKARNADALAKAIATLEKLYNEQRDIPIKVETVKAGGMEVSALMFLQFNVAWTVRNGYLYISSINGIASAVAQVEKKGPSIVTSDSYKRVLASLVPAGAKPTTIAYSHPARLYPDLRNLVLGILPLLRTQAKIDVPMDLLPDPLQVSEFMPPGGSITWSDAEGFHGVGISAFPGAEILAGQDLKTPVALGFMGAGLVGWRYTRAPMAQPAIVLP